MPEERNTCLQFVGKVVVGFELTPGLGTPHAPTCPSRSEPPLMGGDHRKRSGTRKSRAQWGRSGGRSARARSRESHPSEWCGDAFSTSLTCMRKVRLRLVLMLLAPGQFLSETISQSSFSLSSGDSDVSPSQRPDTSG